jgi:hypothetical protein
MIAVIRCGIGRNQNRFACGGASSELLVYRVQTRLQCETHFSVEQQPVGRWQIFLLRKKDAKLLTAPFYDGV